MKHGLYLVLADDSFIRAHDGKNKEWDYDFPSLEERRVIKIATWEWWINGHLMDTQPMNERTGYGIPICGQSLANTPLLYFKGIKK